MWRLWCIMLLGLVATGQAAVLDATTTTQGVLATAQTATGVSTNSLHVGRQKFRSLVLTLVTTAGTATSQLEINCTPSDATQWGLVAGSSTALTVGTAAAQSLIYPACDYRVNTTACTGCSVSANFFLGPDMQ